MNYSPRPFVKHSFCRPRLHTQPYTAQRHVLPRARASKRKGRAEAASLDPVRPWHFRVERSCNESQVTKQSRSGCMETEELTFFGERFVKSYFIGTKGEKGFVLLCKKMVGIILSSVWPTSGRGMVKCWHFIAKRYLRWYHVCWFWPKGK